MFRQFHFKFTCFCAGITLCILCTFSVLLLFISEKNLVEKHVLSFQYNMGNLVSGLEQRSVISMEYLMQAEQDGGYLLYLWDGDVPFLFNSAPSHKGQEALVKDALACFTRENEGQTTLQGGGYASVHQEMTYQAPDGSVYDLCRATIKTSSYDGSPLTMLLLAPRTGLQEQLHTQRLWFLLLSFGAGILLSAFAWFFTGRLLRPIEQNRVEQIQFVAAASHELRTPLTVIRSCISTRQPGYEAIMEAESVRMGHLIDDLLLLSGMETGKYSIQKVPVEPDTLLLNVYEQSEPLALAKAQILSICLPDAPLAACEADPERLTQVLLILIQNAICYTPEHGRIALSVSQEGKHTCFQVADNGIGIPKEHKTKIFDRFYQVDSSHHHKEHYGLGLCIAKELIALHHGELTVCDTPGGGSTFRVIL